MRDSNKLESQQEVRSGRIFRTIKGKKSLNVEIHFELTINTPERVYNGVGAKPQKVSIIF